MKKQKNKGNIIITVVFLRNRLFERRLSKLAQFIKTLITPKLSSLRKVLLHTHFT